MLDRCRYIPPRLAEPEELLRKHSQELITLLKDSQTKTADELEEISSRYDSIFICPVSAHILVGCCSTDNPVLLEIDVLSCDVGSKLQETYRLALFATGSTIDLVTAVCNDEVKNGMAIVR